MNILIIALLLGIAFGFLLQKGGVANFNIIIGQLLFKNFTVLTIIMTAIIVGGIFINLLIDFGFLSAPPVNVSSINGSLVGGLIFGVGMAILGYCPGTALAAIGQGSKDALFGILGMIFGSFLFIQLADIIKVYILTDTQASNTLSSLFNISPYFIFCILAVITLIINLTLSSRLSKSY